MTKAKTPNPMQSKDPQCKAKDSQCKTKENIDSHCDASAQGKVLVSARIIFFATLTFFLKINTKLIKIM